MNFFCHYRQIPFPDIANMTLEEIDVALNKYNAGLNGIKGQIELINESVPVEQHSSASVASRLLIKQRSEYQKVMVTIMDIVNALQSQKELLKKIEEQEALINILETEEMPDIKSR